MISSIDPKNLKAGQEINIKFSNQSKGATSITAIFGCNVTNSDGTITAYLRESGACLKFYPQSRRWVYVKTLKAQEESVTVATKL